MRISDWSSDVCSSDLIGDRFLDLRDLARRDIDARAAGGEIALDDHLADPARAAGDERDAAIEAEHLLKIHKIILCSVLPCDVRRKRDASTSSGRTGSGNIGV